MIEGLENRVAPTVENHHVKLIEPKALPTVEHVIVAIAVRCERCWNEEEEVRTDHHVVRIGKLASVLVLGGECDDECAGVVIGVRWILDMQQGVTVTEVPMPIHGIG